MHPVQKPPTGGLGLIKVESEAKDKIKQKTSEK